MKSKKAHEGCFACKREGEGFDVGCEFDWKRSLVFLIRAFFLLLALDKLV